MVIDDRPFIGTVRGLAALAGDAVEAVHTVAADVVVDVLVPLILDGVELLFGGVDQGTQPSRPVAEWREQAAA